MFILQVFGQNNISVQNTSSGGTNFDYIYYIDINNVLINIKSCKVFSNNMIYMVVISCRRNISHYIYPKDAKFLSLDT